MNIAMRRPRMTREQFFRWAEAQEERYEFDGFEPVAMNGGTMAHYQIALNLYSALRARLRDGPCRAAALGVGVATMGDAVRYPDVVVSCSKTPDESRMVEQPVMVCEVISPTSGRIDRIVKLREYGAVPSVRRYLIVEYASVDVTVLSRAAGQADWTATTLTAGDTLVLPELGIEIPVAELYEGTDIPASDAPDEATPA